MYGVMIPYNVFLPSEAVSSKAVEQGLRPNFLIFIFFLITCKFAFKCFPHLDS